MQIEFDIGPQDMIDFNLHVHWSPARRKQWLTRLLTYAALFSVTGVALLDAQDRALAAMGPFFIVAAAVTVVSGLFLTPRRMRQQITKFYPHDKSSAMYGWRRLTIDAERILQEGELIVTGCKWPAVERIELSERQVLFTISQAAALIIPRRAFADEFALNQFIETARQFHSKATNRRDGSAVKSESAPTAFSR